MMHWYFKVTIILRKRKNVKEIIIVRRREYVVSLTCSILHMLHKPNYYYYGCFYYSLNLNSIMFFFRSMGME